MNYPEYVKVGDKKYKINTDFKVALKCNKIAEDESIGNIERSLAIIYTLFGEEGINAREDYVKLLELAQKYLLCGKEYKDTDEKPDMDFEQDYGLIWASIYGDFNGLDIDKEKIHWWKFMDLMNGLSNSELGDCCALNRVRNFRNLDLSKIEDPKERQKAQEIQNEIRIKKYDKKAKPHTKEQEEMVKKVHELFGLRRE